MLAGPWSLRYAAGTAGQCRGRVDAHAAAGRVLMNTVVRDHRRVGPADPVRTVEGEVGDNLDAGRIDADHHPVGARLEIEVLGEQSCGIVVDGGCAHRVGTNGDLLGDEDAPAHEHDREDRGNPEPNQAATAATDLAATDQPVHVGCRCLLDFRLPVQCSPQLLVESHDSSTASGTPGASRARRSVLIAANESDFHGAGRTAQRVSDLCLRQVLAVTQHDHRPLPWGQRAHQRPEQPPIQNSRLDRIPPASGS